MESNGAAGSLPGELPSPAGERRGASLGTPNSAMLQPANRLLNVRCCTWNIGGCSTDDLGSLGPLVAPDGVGADVIAFGVQECVGLTFWNIVIADESGDADVHNTLINKILRELMSAAGIAYELVTTVGLVGLFMMVFVRPELKGEVCNVARDNVKTGSILGVSGIAGNKGGVRVRFNLAQWELCFVNLHLAAGVGSDKEDARHEDLKAIMSTPFQKESRSGKNSNHKASTHRVTILCGDFNFRLELPEGLDWPPTEDRMEWLAYDELTRSMQQATRHGYELSNYTEGRIYFMPTYRYEWGSGVLDRRRVPAWCDRIFYKAADAVPVDLLEYRSVEVLDRTDHMPVTALFQLGSENGSTSSVVRKISSQTSNRISDSFKCWGSICSPRIKPVAGDHLDMFP